MMIMILWLKPEGGEYKFPQLCASVCFVCSRMGISIDIAELGGIIGEGILYGKPSSGYS